MTNLATQRTPESYIIAAIDVRRPTQALALVQELNPFVGMFQLGPVFLHASSRLIHDSPAEAEAALQLAEITQGRLVLDLGLHNARDSIVRTATIIAERLQPRFITVQTSAGREVLRSLAQSTRLGRTQLAAITVATSLTPDECQEIYGNTPEVIATRFARIAQEAGIHYAVCSPLELHELRRIPVLRNGMRFITPGIRPLWTPEARGQARFATPEQALQHGAYAFVIGSPLYMPSSAVGTPAQAAQRLHDDVAHYLSSHS